MLPLAPAGPIDWVEVRRAAEDGADEPLIITALEIPEPALADQGVLAEFRRVIAVGRARYHLQLRRAVKDRGLKTKRGAGSVNALALQTRNELGWDRQVPTQETVPDLGTARQRLRDLFALLAKSRSEIEGRTVTVLELLQRESEIRPEAPNAEPA